MWEHEPNDWKWAFSVNVWGCYLMDVDQQTLCAYQYLPGEKQLRLVAARNFKNDRKLGNYNTANPSPNEVRDLIDKEQGADRVRGTPAPLNERRSTELEK